MAEHRMTKPWTILPAMVVVAWLAGGSGAETAAPAAPFANLKLTDSHGRGVSVKDFADTPLLVVAFVGTECPLAKLYGGRLGEMAKAYEDRGVQFLAIDSNVQDTLTEVAAYARRQEISFPVLLDPEQQAADVLGATRTPEVFLLDAERQVRYQGRIDDQYAVGVQRNEPQRRDLAAAIDELLADQPVSVDRTPAAGCLIGRRRSVTPTGEITYAKHVAPILYRRCAECHRDGEIAPFSLMSFADVRGWEAMIAEVVTEDRMPPWNANPAYGHFKNDARLTDDEKQTLLAWIRNGAPEGDAADLPAPPEFTDGWRIAEPDVIVKTRDEPYAVRAEGVVDYQYFTVDPKFTEDKYVVAAEARPGNREVVHHIIAYVRPPELEKKKGSKKKQGLGRMLIGYAPGTSPLQFEPGTAIRIPKGSTFVFEMHYTPNGTAQTDISSVGLKFCDAADVKHLIGGSEAINHDFAIPPGDGAFVVTAERNVPLDVQLLALTPHMHLRGKSFRYEAIYPDGRTETLLDVPRYDFNWQLRYELAEPLLLPKNTVIRCTATFDNSEANPNNPDPSQTVTWGRQSWEEMMIGFVTYVDAE